MVTDRGTEQVASPQCLAVNHPSPISIKERRDVISNGNVQSKEVDSFIPRPRIMPRFEEENIETWAPSGLLPPTAGSEKVALTSKFPTAPVPVTSPFVAVVCSLASRAGRAPRRLC